MAKKNKKFQGLDRKELQQKRLSAAKELVGFRFSMDTSSLSQGTNIVELRRDWRRLNRELQIGLAAKRKGV